MTQRRKTPRKKPLAPTIGAGVAAALKERGVRHVSDEVKKWEARIRFATTETEARYSIYDDNESTYYGQSMTKQQKESSRLNRQYAMEINKLMPVLASQRERILPRVPWMKLNPIKVQSKIENQRMRGAEMVENFFFRAPRTNFHRKASLCLLGAELGIGLLEVTFTPDEGIEPEEDKEPHYAELGAEVDPETGEETLDSPDGEPLLREDGSFIRRGRGNKVLIDQRDPLDYFGIRYVHWRDFLFDTESGNELEDTDWLATRFGMRLDVAQENRVFDSKARGEFQRIAKSLSTNRPRDIIRPPRPYEDQTVGQSALGDDFRRITGWRVWHASKRQNIYLVDGYEEIAGKYEYPKWVGHSPLVALKFHEKLGELLPQTEVEFARPPLTAYNLFWGTLLNHLKRYKRKYIVAPSAFDKPEQRDQLLDPDDGMVIEATGGKNAVVPLEDAYLDPAIYKMMDNALADFHEAMGSVPQAVQSADSATQSAILDRRGVGREDEKREILAHTFEGLGDKVLACLQANLPTEIAIRMAGPDGRTWRTTKGRADIQGQFKNWIDLIEMSPWGQSPQAQEMLSLINLVGPEMALASENFSQAFFRTISRHDPNIAADFTEMALLLFGQRLFGSPTEGAPGQGDDAGKGGGGAGTTQGAAKPTGQGPEAGTTTEGRSQGRALRTLAGPISTPPQRGAA